MAGLFGENAGDTPAATDTYAIAYRLPLNIFTAVNLNSSATGKPLGLVVKLFQLKDYRRFRRAPLAAFLSAGDIQSILGDDLISSRVITLTPGHRYPLVVEIHNGVNYLGVAALFMAPARHRWRVAFDTEKSRPDGMTIGFNACAMAVTSGHLITRMPGQPGSLSTVECPDDT